MEINIKDHLTDEDLKNIATAQAVKVFSDQFNSENELKRIVTNSAYGIVYKMVDSVLDNELQNLIKTKVEEIIKGLSEFSIFNKPDAWSRETNNAYDYLQKCIEDNFPKIQDIVNEQIEPQALERFREAIDDFIVDAVRDIFKTKK